MNTNLFARLLAVLVPFVCGCQAPQQQSPQQHRDVSWILPYSPEGTIRVYAPASFTDDEVGIETEYPFVEVLRQRVGWIVYLWAEQGTKYTLATFIRRDRAIRFAERLAKQLSARTKAENP